MGRGRWRGAIRQVSDARAAPHHSVPRTNLPQAHRLRPRPPCPQSRQWGVGVCPRVVGPAVLPWDRVAGHAAATPGPEWRPHRWHRRPAVLGATCGGLGRWPKSLTPFWLTPEADTCRAPADSWPLRHGSPNCFTLGSRRALGFRVPCEDCGVMRGTGPGLARWGPGGQARAAPSRKLSRRPPPLPPGCPRGQLFSPH